MNIFSLNDRNLPLKYYSKSFIYANNLFVNKFYRNKNQNLQHFIDYLNFIF